MNINDFAVKLKDLVKDVPEDQRTRALSLAAGYIAGYAMPVYADKEDLTADAVFSREHAARVRDVLGQVNKVLVVGLADAVEIARHVWVMRYNMVHNAMAPESLILLSGIIRDQVRAGLSDVVDNVDPVLVVNLATQFAEAALEATA